MPNPHDQSELPASPISRRALVAAGLAAVLAACRGPGRDAGGTAEPDATAAPETPAGPIATPAPAGPATTTVAPVDVPGYTVLAGEVEPECKQAAVDAVTAALTWRADVGLEAARQRVVAAGGAPAALDGLAPLVDGTAWSSLRVVYPQYGGLLADRSSASVMLAVEQVLPGDGRPRTRGRTVDARLVRRGRRWTVTELRLADLPSAAAAPSAAARAVLDSDGVVLPAAARADVEAGVVDDLVLGMLAQLGERWRLDVLVLRTGHPHTVFGSDRQSNHTRGRAVDVWAVDGVPVVDHGRAAWREVMGAAAEIGADEIGGPRDLDGVRGRRPFFSDLLHQDHVHLGFEPR